MTGDAMLEPYLSLAPDWVCEVLSPSAAKLDRADKLPIDPRESVRHVWLLDPLQHTLERCSICSCRCCGPKSSSGPERERR